MLDQKRVVLPVEVDILEKLLLAHLLSLLIKIGFKKCDSPHICMPSPVPPAERKLSSETSEEDKKTWSIIERGSSCWGSGQVSSGKPCRYVRVASPFLEKACE